jgi:molecular chaperone DnaK
MIFQTEKTLTDLGDKVTEDEKKGVNEKKEALKEAIKGTDVEKIKTAESELSQKIYEISSRIYAQTAQQGGNPGAENGAQGNPGADYSAQDGTQGNPDVHEANYREVNNDDDNNNNK